MKQFTKKIKYDDGAAMLIAIIFFLFASTTIVLGVTTPILKQARISTDLVRSKESYYYAEGALEDAIYRIKNGKNISSGDTLVLNGYTTTITLTTTSNGKTIDAVSNRDGIVRKMQSQVVAGVGASFNYGVHSGQGGFIMSNSTVNGNVYSNGIIEGDNGAKITGSAFSAGASGLIDNVLVGQSGVGNASARIVKNSTIAENLYCQVGQNNNKSCNTTQSDPEPIPFSIIDTQINEWKADATSGGTSGSYNPSQDSSLGPKKINGDMTLDDSNLDFIINGVIYVTGDVDLSNNQGSVRCSPSFGSNSCILVADGSIHIKNNITFGGSGQTGSFLLLLSTLDCDGSDDESPTSGKECGHHDGAIDLHNNSTGSILYAPYGKLNLHQNVNITEATAYKIELENNAIINYDQGLANILFSSGPSGGWSISSWQEVE